MKIFLDMDGVLCKCHETALFMNSVVGIMPKSTPMHKIVNDHVGSGYTRDQFWESFSEYFWANLPKTGLCNPLIDICQEIGEVFIATSPTSPQSASGKLKWVQKYCPILYEKTIIIHDKSLLAPGVLIDDSRSNTEKFIAAGGKGIFVPRPWNGNMHDDEIVLHQLEKL